MIRIDLGKGSKKQGETMRRIATTLKLQQPYDELLAKFDNDVSRLIAFFISIAVAVLPYLIVGEYERVVTRNFQRKMTEIDKEVAVVKAEIQDLTPFKQELESYEAQKKQVSSRLEVVRRLVDQRSTPVATLDSVSQSLPEAVWIESLSFEGSDGAAKKLSVRGRSLSNEDISDYVDRLSQSSYLKNVRINGVEAGQMLGQDIKSFNLDLEANTLSNTEPARALGSN